MDDAHGRRIRVQWTLTAMDCLRHLPRKVRAGLMEKADQLAHCGDPRSAHKPLVGPLSGCYRITYARYRAIYMVTEETLRDGDVVEVVTVVFIAAGIRKERSKDDVYRLAQKIVDMGLIDLPGSAEEDP